MNDLYPLIEAEIPRLRRFARYLSRDIDEADDLVQECLLRAVKNLNGWERGTNLRAWLFVILRNVYINTRRRASRSPIASQVVVDHVSDGVSGDQESRHEMMAVQKAFDQMSDEHREILTLVTIEGFEYEEAAKILEIPIGTVRSRLSRARSTLQGLLDGAERKDREKVTERQR